MSNAHGVTRVVVDVGSVYASWRVELDLEGGHAARGGGEPKAIPAATLQRLRVEAEAAFAGGDTRHSEQFADGTITITLERGDATVRCIFDNESHDRVGHVQQLYDYARNQAP